METATLAAGTTLIEEGEEGDALFVILEGAASVRRKDTVVATVGPGAWFGELALLDGEPRSATVVATEPTTVAVLGVRHVPHAAARVPGDDQPGARRARVRPPPRTREALDEATVSGVTATALPRDELDRLVAESAMFGPLEPAARSFVCEQLEPVVVAGRHRADAARATPVTRCTSSRSAGSGSR